MPLKHIHDVSLSWLGTGNNVWMIPAGNNSSSEEVVIVIKKKLYQVYCAWCVSGITFRYAHIQSIGKINNLVSWEF